MSFQAQLKRTKKETCKAACIVNSLRIDVSNIYDNKEEESCSHSSKMNIVRVTLQHVREI